MNCLDYKDEVAGHGDLGLILATKVVYRLCLMAV